MTTLDISKHGDWVEQKYASFIKGQLDAYEKIWQIYIGNDGNAHMCGMENISEEDNKRRQKFAEHHYTCLENLLCMQQISDKLQDWRVQNVEDLLEIATQFIAFEAHCGRVRDSMKDMCYLLLRKGRDCDKQVALLDNYYEQRHTVLHGKKLPFGVLEGVVRMPEPGGKVPTKSDWYSGKSWDDVQESDLNSLPDYCSRTLIGLAKNVNQILYNLYGTIVKKAKVNDWTLILPVSDQKYKYNTFSPQTSGGVSIGSASLPVANTSGLVEPPELQEFEKNDSGRMGKVG